MTQDEIETYTLAEARKSVGFSQGKLRKRTGVSITTISNCERGQPILPSLARLMLNTINNERKMKELPEIKETQMLWRLSSRGGDDD